MRQNDCERCTLPNIPATSTVLDDVVHPCLLAFVFTQPRLVKVPETYIRVLPLSPIFPATYGRPQSMVTRFVSWETLRGRRTNVSTSTTQPPLLSSCCRCGLNLVMSTCPLVAETAGARRGRCIPLSPGHSRTLFTGANCLLLRRPPTQRMNRSVTTRCIIVFS